MKALHFLAFMIMALGLGCEHDSDDEGGKDKKDDASFSTNSTKSDHESSEEQEDEDETDDRKPVPTDTELMSPYFGDWSGETTYESEGTNYTAKVSQFVVFEDANAAISAGFNRLENVNTTNGVGATLNGNVPLPFGRWDDAGKVYTSDLGYAVTFVSEDTALFSWPDFFGPIRVPLTRTL